MAFQFDPLTLALQGGAIVLAALGASVAVRSDLGPGLRDPTAIGVVGLGVATALWSVTSLVSRSIGQAGAAIAVHHFVLIAAALAVGTWVLTGLSLTWQRRHLAIAAAVLLIEPVTVAILTVTNPVHHLLYASVSVAAVDDGTRLAVEPGPAFWFHVVYSYLGLLVGGVELVRRSLDLQDTDTLFVVVAATLPLVATLLLTLGITPAWTRPGPLGLGASTLLLAIGTRDLVTRRQRRPGEGTAADPKTRTVR